MQRNGFGLGFFSTLAPVSQWFSNCELEHGAAAAGARMMSGKMKLSYIIMMLLSCQVKLAEFADTVLPNLIDFWI